MQRIDSTYIKVKILKSDFKEIRHIAKKVKCKVKIIKKSGFPFFINKYRKRKIIAIASLVIAIFIFGTSKFIWNVEINGNENISTDEIIELVNNYGISIGKLKSNINTEKVSNLIRLERDDISWIGITIKGTNAIITIEETTEKPDMMDNYVYSRSNLEKIYYEKEEKANFVQIEKEVTGNEEEKHEICINNFKINFKKGVSKFQNYDTITTNKKLKLFSDFYLPIEIKSIKNIEYKNIEVTYTKEELIEKLETKLDKELEEEFNLSKYDDKYKKREVYTNEESDGITVKLVYEIQKEITTKEKIE